MEHFNNLTPAEHERLALLMEECGEVIQIVGKIFRHGYESYHPNDPKKVTNRVLLQKEIGHVNLAVQLMNEKEDLEKARIEYFMKLKNLTIGEFLHHQESGI